MAYAAEQDPLCYPDTTVLRNKLDIQNQAELDEYELAVFLTRAEEQWPAGSLDYAHYRALHHHLFQDVYDWAGDARTIRVGKDGNWFCYPEYIDREMNRIFNAIRAADYFRGLQADAFARQTAYALAEINAVHPFREGNGRTQLALLSILVENAGLPFNDDLLVPDRVIEAMIESFSGNEAPLVELIEAIVTG